jgi:hypothetical protein
VNWASEGAPSETVAAAFPVFTRRSDTGAAATPVSVAGNAAEVGELGANAIVAPLGVTESGTFDEGAVGSFVKTLSDPDMAAPAADDAGTLAVTVNVAVSPGATRALSGETEKAVPVVAAPTARAPEPLFWTVNDWLPD